jgi:hypothetical protein
MALIFCATSAVAEEGCNPKIVYGDAMPVSFSANGPKIGSAGVVTITFPSGAIITTPSVGLQNPCDPWDAFTDPEVGCTNFVTPVDIYSVQTGQDGLLYEANLVWDLNCDGTDEYNIPFAMVRVD